MSDDELLGALGLDVAPAKVSKLSARDERIIAGFEEIVRFAEENCRLPQHGEDRDIFERLYATRLDRIRQLPEAHTLLSEIDQLGLLGGGELVLTLPPSELDDDELLAELGIEPKEADISNLTHVRTNAERQAAEEIANRTKCLDFDDFRERFEELESGIKSDQLEAVRFEIDTSVAVGDSFILYGQFALVAESGPEIQTTPGKTDARLRVIYSNGTESNLLRRSLQRALYKDEGGRRVREKELGGLFGDVIEEGDVQSGTIYVLRSLSDHPYIAEHRDLIHKIGVTGGNVRARIADAKNDPTYLLAGVELLAEYKLAGVSRSKLEQLIHRIFGVAQIEIEIPDRFGKNVRPKEWFLVPLHVIKEGIDRIVDGSIERYKYDPMSGKFLELE
jgi:hypothetical protein